MLVLFLFFFNVPLSLVWGRRTESLFFSGLYHTPDSDQPFSHPSISVWVFHSLPNSTLSLSLCNYHYIARLRMPLKKVKMLQHSTVAKTVVLLQRISPHCGIPGKEKAGCTTTGGKWRNDAPHRRKWERKPRSANDG